MPPLDPVLLADARAWLAKAKMDLRGAEVDLAARPPLTGDALFHCQQAVEKSFKGFLAWRDHPFRKTHSLEELGEQCLTIDPSLAEIVDLVVPLTEYAWKFRYPGEPSEPSIDEAQVALDLARRAFAAAVARLPREIGF